MYVLFMFTFAKNILCDQLIDCLSFPFLCFFYYSLYRRDPLTFCHIFRSFNGCGIEEFLFRLLC